MNNTTISALAIGQKPKGVSAVKLSEMKASRNITLMVLWTCVIYFMFMTPYNLSYILRLILVTSPELTLYNLVCSVLLTVAHGATFFVYLFYNNLFRKILVSYLRKMVFLK